MVYKSANTHASVGTKVGIPLYLWSTSLDYCIRRKELLPFQNGRPARRLGFPKWDLGLWLEQVSADFTATTRGYLEGAERDFQIRAYRQPRRVSGFQLDGAILIDFQWQNISRVHVVEIFQEGQGREVDAVSGRF